MDFGKLPSVDSIRFDLPAPEPRSAKVLEQSDPKRNVSVYVGGSVWACPSWVGSLYPPGTKAKHFLEIYSRQVAATELNPTFYHIPSLAQVRRWRELTPEGFQFSPKLHQSISHASDLNESIKGMKEFWSVISTFEARLGLCFLQLPPHFSFQSFGVLQMILPHFQNPEKLSIEFRHPSWFQNQMLRPEIFDYLHNKKISTVITDVAGRRDVLHASLTTNQVLIRFVGNEPHPSDGRRLLDWVDRLKAWTDEGLKEIYFYIHQPTQAGVPGDVRFFIQELNSRLNLNLPYWTESRIPALQEKSSSDQLSFF